MPKYIFNPVTLLYEVKEDPKALRFIKMAVTVLAAAGAAYLCFWLYGSVLHWDLPKTAVLKKRLAVWEARTAILKGQIDVYDATLKGIEDRDDDVYRSIYGLGEIPDQVRFAGLEGEDRYEELNRLGAGADLQSIVRRVDVLTKRAYIESKSLDEVGAIARTAGDMVSCVPAIPPLAPIGGKYNLSSSFGYRTDPVYGGSEFHSGQDFSHPYGTPVYATGDGVVEKASFQFGGYGNEVVIDHGYGYKSRYAHMSTIVVNVGMKIKRGDQVGAVGNSGKSTGAHLHYEVEYRDSKVNPLNYMDLTIPASEYKAMIQKRQEESPEGKRTSTSEILKRSRHEYE